MKFAEDYCERRSQENAKKNDEAKRADPHYDENEDLPNYELVYLMDEDDLRALTGEVHRPYVIARKRAEVEVTAPKKHGEGDRLPADAAEV